MKKKLPLQLVVILILIVLQKMYAQEEATHWYFGEYAGIRFEWGEPIAVTNGSATQWEGTAAVSSSTGELLFYTNGETVFDANHSVMPNGSYLLGNISSSQSAMIIPSPGSSDIYYIFTIDEVDYNGGASGLRYTKVDMSLNNGLGDVVDTVKNVLLEPNVSEKLTATRHSNGIDYWVIIPKWGTNNFYSYLVTVDSVSTDPVISSDGAIIAENIDNAKGYMKVSHDGTKIAKANAGLRFVEVFDFNNINGEVSNVITLFNISAEPYGIEFSPSNQYLYVNSWKSKPQKVLAQYDLFAGDEGDIKNSRVEIATGTDGALQLGPDNRIYVAVNMSVYLKRINHPDKKDTLCDFETNAVYLEGKLCRWGLPNFVSWEIDTTVGVNQINIKEEFDILICPNPTREMFKIKSTKFESGGYSITVCNLFGSRILEILIPKGQTVVEVNTLGWEQGIYIAKIKQNNSVVAGKKIWVN